MRGATSIALKSKHFQHESCNLALQATLGFNNVFRAAFKKERLLNSYLVEQSLSKQPRHLKLWQ